ncbi:centrosomal protein of 120 kDa-like [Melitaea cinxia]|uniref:centrosomal protein of 120 kDa-like n=1 Tax=Melitaea cinxia TaxID=113334 RepID=UPI001E26EF40|nr:centrosomal protein of 120 kDa-like [Melitaea cinxia]
MDELRGPTIQIVLNVKEGLGFGFLKCPFIVSGSLNGYMLETDPVLPAHAPVFDAELVWEADKRRFRSLRVQNVPVKIEVYTTATQGRKDKVGYLLLSLLGAQPCPSNKIVDLKHSWHKLLGVKSEGKCCHPQLLLSLSVEDRISTPTPRNELRMFHSNEVAFPSAQTKKNIPKPESHTMLLTLNEYIAESKKTVSSPDLRPTLICDEGLIQIGSDNHLFILELLIGTVENIDLLLPTDMIKEDLNCYVTYTVFTHTITTDRAAVHGSRAALNQRSSLRVRSCLRALAQYFARCPLLVATLRAQGDVGICSLDLRKLIPTDNIEEFLNNFCNNDNSLTIYERCFMIRCDGVETKDRRKPYMDVELSLRYLGEKKNVQKQVILTARSVTQLESERSNGDIEKTPIEIKSGSCTDLNQDIGDGYTNIAPGNTTRYKTASGDTILQSNELAEIIKNMCESFVRTRSSRDVTVQCDDVTSGQCTGDRAQETEKVAERFWSAVVSCEEVTALKEDPLCRGPLGEGDSDMNSFSLRNDFKSVLSPAERDVIIKKYVEELEDWKERQQELFKLQLKRKEEYHLELLANEWSKRKNELEYKLSKGIEQCRNLAEDLSRATEDFRLRGYRNTERERKLLDAKKALESHYTSKYQELREASQKMEDDMNHQLKMKDMAIEELQTRVQLLEKQNEVIKNNMKNFEKNAENKYSGLTKDQTASLIQELRCLEEKLDSAVQSKAFFKEQWGRAVRELHLVKLGTRRQMLDQLRRERRQLGDDSLDPIIDEKEESNKSDLDINKLKENYYVDILANSPALDSNSIISPHRMDMLHIKNITKNPSTDKLGELISQRDQLIRQENPDEDTIKQLNHEIRNMLINCGT